MFNKRDKLTSVINSWDSFLLCHPNGFHRRNVKEYELVVLYHPDLEVDISKPLEKVAEIIKSADGKIINEDDWGRKKLAYKIAGENFAIYRVYTLELPAAAVKKINDTLNITSEVLRFLLTKIDPKVKQMIEEEQKLEKEKEENNDSNETPSDSKSSNGAGEE